jgi:hypothetical protein
MIRSSLQITNTGYRLLRTTVRVEPASATWVKLPADSARGPIVTVDQTDLAIEVHIPENYDEPPSATVVLDSNGGTRRVEVRLERPAAPALFPDAPDVCEQHPGLSLGTVIARQPLPLRLITWSLGALLLRVLLLASALVASPGPDRPTLAGAAIVMAVVGCVAAVRFALKHGELRDVPAVGFAGGLLGVFAATVLVAACRTLEPLLGRTLAASPIAVCLLWGVLGAALAGLSAVLAPPRTEPEGPT